MEIEQEISKYSSDHTDKKVGKLTKMNATQDLPNSETFSTGKPHVTRLYQWPILCSVIKKHMPFCTSFVTCQGF